LWSKTLIMRKFSCSHTILERNNLAQLAVRSPKPGSEEMHQQQDNQSIHPRVRLPPFPGPLLPSHSTGTRMRMYVRTCVCGTVCMCDTACVRLCVYTCTHTPTAHSFLALHSSLAASMPARNPSSARAACQPLRNAPLAVSAEGAEGAAGGRGGGRGGRGSAGGGAGARPYTVVAPTPPRVSSGSPAKSPAKYGSTNTTRTSYAQAAAAVCVCVCVAYCCGVRVCVCSVRPNNTLAA
jgi:hypothetical protein